MHFIILKKAFNRRFILNSIEHAERSKKLRDLPMFFYDIKNTYDLKRKKPNNLFQLKN